MHENNCTNVWTVTNKRCIFASTKTNKHKNYQVMTIFANTSNGNQEQVKLTGDMKKIFDFIESYEGNDLGNDLICQDFVTDAEPTGVIIFAK